MLMLIYFGKRVGFAVPGSSPSRIVSFLETPVLGIAYVSIERRIIKIQLNVFPRKMSRLIDGPFLSLPEARQGKLTCIVAEGGYSMRSKMKTI